MINDRNDIASPIMTIKASKKKGNLNVFRFIRVSNKRSVKKIEYKYLFVSTNSSL
jgi:hypothetical protein